MTLAVADDQGLGLVREVLLAHSYWRMLGLAVDLVILNREPHSYDSPLRRVLDRLIHTHSGWPTGTSEGSVYVLNWRELLPADVAVRACALSIPQLVSLRFASDAELPELVNEVLSGQLTDAKAIKQRVKEWQADHLRA